MLLPSGRRLLHPSLRVKSKYNDLPSFAGRAEFHETEPLPYAQGAERSCGRATLAQKGAGGRATHYVIVTGCPRSGTSFLGDALRALPNSECIFGLHLPVTVPQFLDRALPPEVHDALIWGFRHSVENYLETISNSRSAALSRLALGHAPIGDTWRAFRRRRVVEWVVYKEPFLTFAPQFAFNAFPESRLIVLVRDGRDCAQSLVSTYDVLTDEKLSSLSTAEAPIGRRHDHRYVPWWVESKRETEFLESVPFVRAIWMWKEMVRRWREFARETMTVATGRILEVRYETLATDPQAIRQAVEAHLRVKADGRMVHHFGAAHADSIGGYRRRDPAEIREAERIARAELELYGYL